MTCKAIHPRLNGGFRLDVATSPLANRPSEREMRGLRSRYRPGGTIPGILYAKGRTWRTFTSHQRALGVNLTSAHLSVRA